MVQRRAKNDELLQVYNGTRSTVMSLCYRTKLRYQTMSFKIIFESFTCLYGVTNELGRHLGKYDMYDPLMIQLCYSTQTVRVKCLDEITA